MKFTEKNLITFTRYIACALLVAVISIGYSNQVVLPVLEDGCQEKCPEHCDDSNNNCDDCAYCHHTIYMNYQSIHILNISDLEPSQTINFIPVFHERILVDQIDHPPKSV